MTDSTPKYQPQIDKSILGAIGDYSTVNQYIQSQPAQPSPYMLPQDIGDFTGREDYIAQIESTLDRGKIAAIAGIPGVGKSALAIRVAYRIKDRYPDAQLYVNLYGQTPELALDSKTVLIRFLKSLTGQDESQLATDLEGLKGQYRSILATKQALIILDNARDESQIRDLLPSNPKCAVVVTSRSRLTGLPGVGSIDLEPMAVGIDRVLGEAELLFQAILQDGKRVEAELPAAREIVNLCGRLPIAIRITAATLDRQIWARKSLQAYAQELAIESTRLSKLENENVEKAIPGQGSVRASFNLSYQGLTEGERQLFRWAGGLPGVNFGLEILAAVMEQEESQIEAGLGRLLEAQVLELRGDNRFGWHDLMRLFAKAQLSESERETVVDRGLSWYCEGANYWNDGLNPLRCRQLAQQAAAKTESSVDEWERALPMMALDWFAAEQDNWVDIVKDLTQVPYPDDAIDLAAKLVPFFSLRGIWGDWVTTHEIVKDCAQQAGNLVGISTTLNNLGLVYQNQGKLDDAIACYEKSLEIFRQLGYDQGIAQNLGNLGIVYRNQGKWDEAISCHEQSLEIFRRLEDDQGIAQNLGNSGNVYQKQGKMDEAIACYEQSLGIFRQLRDRHGVGQTLMNLGSLYQNQGKLDEAISYYEQSLEIKRQLGDDHGAGKILVNLGLLHDQRNQPEQARTFWQEALTYLHPSSPEFQTVQQLLNTPTPPIVKPRQVSYLLPLAMGGFILFCLVKGYWLLAIFGVVTILFGFRRSIFRGRGM
jgi:tetratricopeptide (TPR) repeat protein